MSIQSIKIISVLVLSLLVSACSGFPQVTTVETRNIQLNRPGPIIPSTDQLTLREVPWMVITQENFNERISTLPEGSRVLFAINSDGYRNLFLNLSDVRSLIEQQQRIISSYAEHNRTGSDR